MRRYGLTLGQKPSGILTSFHIKNAAFTAGGAAIEGNRKRRGNIVLLARLLAMRMRVHAHAYI
jgi:hypothetical protein